MENFAKKMIPLETAIALINDTVNPLPVERVELHFAFNRVLAEDIISDLDIPPFDKAAMDGFACRKNETGHLLKIVEEIPAGKVPEKELGLNECAIIMTGAMMPSGADHILMKEYAEKTKDGFVKALLHSDNSNICYKGEDVKSGTTVLKKGTKLGTSHMAVLASCGSISPLVYALPAVSVISTGSELVEPDHLPGYGKIRNSNGIQLCSQVKELGLHPEYAGIVPDDQLLLKKHLSSAVKNYHLVLVSGGVSVGDYDYVPEILNKMGVDVLFHGLQVKPGKHMLVAKKDNCLIAGMPGNPVSSFVMFEIIVKAIINRLTGSVQKPLGFKLRAGENFLRKKSDTLLLVPAQIHPDGYVVPMEYHGSAHIHAYTMANAMMEIPAGTSEVKKGDMVYVRPI